MRGGGHHSARRGEDLGDGLVRLQILGVGGRQLRNRGAHDHLSELVGARAEVAFNRGVHVGAQLRVKENADSGKHHRQPECECQRELPADGQAAHPVSSVLSR